MTKTADGIAFFLGIRIKTVGNCHRISPRGNRRLTADIGFGSFEATAPRMNRRNARNCYVSEQKKAGAMEPQYDSNAPAYSLIRLPICNRSARY